MTKCKIWELVINNESVKSFKEKPQTNKRKNQWRVLFFNKRVFDFIDNDKSVLEAEPLEKITNQGELRHLNMMGFGSAWIHQEIKNFENVLNL